MKRDNADFIYYGSTEMVGLHTKKPLILRGKVAKGEEMSDIISQKVFPEYYLIYVERFEDMIKEDIDEWVYFFKHGTIRDDFKSPAIKLAAKKLDYLSLGEKDRRAYDYYLAYLVRERDILDTAREEGEAKGELKAQLRIARELIVARLFGGRDR